MKEIKKLSVLRCGKKAGTLALYKGCLAAFEYDKDCKKSYMAHSHDFSHE